MANDRSSSKQKRARQNRAQREAREARTKAASEPASARQAKYATSAPKGTGTDTKKAARPARERRVRPGDTPVDIDNLQGNWYSKRMQVPGGRQAMTAGLLTVILIPLTIFQKYPEASTPKGEKVHYTQTIWEFYGWGAIPRLALPLIAAVFAVQMIPTKHRRWIWTGCAVVIATAMTMSIPFVFAAGFMYYAAMRSKKIEGQAATGSGTAADEETVADDASEPVDASAAAADDAD